MFTQGNITIKPTFLPPRAAEEIILEAAGRTIKQPTIIKLYWTLLKVLWVENRTFETFGKFRVSLELDNVFILL